MTTEWSVSTIVLGQWGALVLCDIYGALYERLMLNYCDLALRVDDVFSHSEAWINLEFLHTHTVSLIDGDQKFA